MKYENHTAEFHNGTISVYNMDCMELLRQTPDKYYDLACVDPPYGIGDFAQSDRIHHKKIKWNQRTPDIDYFVELKRVSREQIIWGANYYNCFSGNHGAIIWDKLNMHPTMSRCEIASYSRLKKVDIFQYEWYGYLVKREEKGAFHPCQKPAALYDWLLTKYAKKGDKILDTHMGSGSIAIACHNQGYELTACELDKDYYEAAVLRIRQHQSQKRLKFSSV